MHRLDGWEYEAANRRLWLMPPPAGASTIRNHGDGKFTGAAHKPTQVALTFKSFDDGGR
jgi:hypothetical protein